MKKTALLLIGFIFIIGQAMAEIAAATFKTDNGYNIQVIINHKVINSEPKPVVKVKGTGGVHQVKIKIFKDQKEVEIKEKIKISAGYHNKYIISLGNDSMPEVKKTSSSRIYNYRFKRPDKFYNRRFYAFMKKLIKKNPSRNPELAQPVYLAIENKRSDFGVA